MLNSNYFTCRTLVDLPNKYISFLSVEKRTKIRRFQKLAQAFREASRGHWLRKCMCLVFGETIFKEERSVPDPGSSLKLFPQKEERSV